MVVDDITYDIDNRDIEEEMLIQDLEDEVQEEIDAEEEQEQAQEERIQKEAEQTYLQARRVLNSKNLSLDLDIIVENLRPHYVWESEKDGLIYEGCVVHMFDKNTYIFNATVKGKKDYKLKKFTLDTIKQIKK